MAVVKQVVERHARTGPAPAGERPRTSEAARAMGIGPRVFAAAWVPGALCAGPPGTITRPQAARLLWANDSRAGLVFNLDALPARLQDELIEHIHGITTE